MTSNVRPVLVQLPVQVNLNDPDRDVTESVTAAAMLWELFYATIEEVDLKVTDFASCTTHSRSDVKSMCVNHQSKHKILWGCCASHGKQGLQTCIRYLPRSSELEEPRCLKFGNGRHQRYREI